MDKKQTTRGRLMDSACAVFADKGFHHATVAEICEAANANIAAVNYYFGDKEKLYDEVWRHAFAIASSTYPLEGGLPEEPTIEDCLYCYANAILHRIFSDDAAGRFAKLLCREMATPTLALERISQEALLPQSQYLETVIKGFLGDDFDPSQLNLCKHNIIGQCAFYNFSRPLRERFLGKDCMTEEELSGLARHIAHFSLGGLKEIKNEAL